jgi:hypothetical protein
LRCLIPIQLLCLCIGQEELPLLERNIQVELSQHAHAKDDFCRIMTTDVEAGLWDQLNVGIRDGDALEGQTGERKCIYRSGNAAVY